MLWAVSLVSIGYMGNAWIRYRRLLAERELRTRRFGVQPESPWAPLEFERASLEHLLFRPNWISSLRPLDPWGWANLATNAAWAGGLMVFGWDELAAGILTAVAATLMARRLHGRLCQSCLREIERRADPAAAPHWSRAA